MLEGYQKRCRAIDRTIQRGRTRWDRGFGKSCEFCVLGHALELQKSAFQILQNSRQWELHVFFDELYFFDTPESMRPEIIDDFLNQDFRCRRSCCHSNPKTIVQPFSPNLARVLNQVSNPTCRLR